MREYTEIVVEDDDLLPQILRELLALAAKPDYVDVVQGERGRVIHAHPDIADAWYEKFVLATTSASPDGEES